MSNKRKKEKKVYSSDSEEMYRMLKVLGGVVIVLALFYLVFAFARGELSFGKKETKKEVEIQNVEILAGNSFSRTEEEYYVLMYDFDSKNASKYDNIYDMYKSSGLSNKMYLVDLGKKFNSSYVVEDKSKVNISSIDTLKVVDGTLIKVSGGKGTSVSVGVDDIKNSLFS